jgi:hypothetical protein
VIVGWRRRLVSALILSLVALPAAGARAAPLTVRLDYAAASSCPDAADFAAVVIARLAYDPFVESAPEQVVVRLAARDGAVAGRIEWRDPTGRWAGEQSFPPVSTDCPRLVRAMGFAVAVQIQLLASAAALADPPIVDAGPPPAPRTTDPARPIEVGAAAGPSPAPVPRPALAIGAGPSVGVGMSSAPVMMGRLFGVVAWRRLSVEVAAIGTLPTTTRRQDGAGFAQQHLMGSVAACAVAARWGGCILVNGGEVRMAGEDIDRPTSASVLILQAGARAVVRQRLGDRAFLSAHADGLLNLTRWTGRLDQVAVWTAPRLAAVVGIDACLQFP